jgi:hypothetical protein
MKITTMYMILGLIIGDILYMGMFMPFMMSLNSDITPIVGLLSIPLAIVVNVKIIKTLINKLNKTIQ